MGDSIFDAGAGRSFGGGRRRGAGRRRDGGTGPGASALRAPRAARGRGLSA